MSSISGLGPWADLYIFIGLCLAAKLATYYYFSHR